MNHQYSMPASAPAATSAGGNLVSDDQTFVFVLCALCFCACEKNTALSYCRSDRISTSSGNGNLRLIFSRCKNRGWEFLIPVIGGVAGCAPAQSWPGAGSLRRSQENQETLTRQSYLCRFLIDSQRTAPHQLQRTSRPSRVRLCSDFLRSAPQRLHLIPLQSWRPWQRLTMTNKHSSPPA